MRSVVDGLGAARVDAADDRVGVGADRACRRVGGVRQSRGDGVAVRAKGLEGLLAARVDSADDVVGVSAESAGQGERRRR